MLVWASGYMSLPRCAERSAALVLAESGKPFRSKWQCSASPQLDSHLHGFMDVWYTCRPIIEECRLSFWEPSFAKHLQPYAQIPKLPATRANRDKRNHLSVAKHAITVDVLAAWRKYQAAT